MQLFVTGLCLQGNKGGPAIALSLRKVLERELGQVELTLSVPHRDIDREREWAEYFDMAVVADLERCDLLVPVMLLDRVRRQRVANWIERARSAAAIVEMSAISYVGPPAGTTRAAYAGRLRYCLSARILRRPFLAWTQSYGPLSNRAIRAAARFDLGRQRVVFCRGDGCEAVVKELLPNARTATYPDVAATLDFDQGWGRDYIGSLGLEVAVAKVATVSPSSVLFRRESGTGISNRHVQQVRAIVDSLLERGFDVVLVPHSTAPERPVPEECDLTVSRLVATSSGLSSANGGRLHIVEDELGPVQLKSIIACAVLHVGARYHSLVAALSSGVPCVALSWHSKYQDIMRIYGLEHCVVESSEPAEAERTLDRTILEIDQLVSELQWRQPMVEQSVARNAAAFATLLRAAVR